MKPALAWVVRPGDGATVHDIVERMRRLGVEAQGALWLNGRRADRSDPVEPGDRVELYPSRGGGDLDDVRVLAQRDGILLVYKPTALPTEPTQSGGESLVSVLRERLEGAAVHAASRLDVGVSGVVVCTLGGDAARRVSAAREGGRLSRVYVGIVVGAALPARGLWTEPLSPPRRGQRRVRVGAGGRAAETRFDRLGTVELPDGAAGVLRLEPQTGRMHQLRAHAAHAGAPLAGDRLYGGRMDVVGPSGAVHRLDRIALHAVHVSVDGDLAATAPVPDPLKQAWAHLGGDPEVWVAAES